MDIQQFLKSGIIEKYVLGLASPEEMDYVEKMTREYPEVNAHICKMQNCMAEYAELDCTRPLKRLKDKMLSNRGKPGAAFVASNQQDSRTPRSWKWGAGIAAVMIFTFGSLSWIFYTNQEAAMHEIASLSTQIKQLRSEQNTLLADDHKIREKYTVLKDVNTKHVYLKGKEAKPQTHAVIYVNSDHGKCFLNIIRMPKCPLGNEYQMWAEVNGEHVNLGIVKEDDKEAELHSIPCIENCKAFVITLEKAGGSPVPTVENTYAYGGM